VTRFSCGGFVLAYSFNHCSCDAAGALQFITAVAELSRNPHLSNPSLVPVWARELLIPRPRNPPHILFPHYEYKISNNNDMYHPSDFHLHTQSSLFLPRAAVSAIKKLARASASFDAAAALFWQSRARAIGLANTDIAHFLFPVDTRHLQGVSPLPKGYYGAAVVFPCVSVPVDELCQKPLSYAASQIAMTKHLASQPEYRSSVIDYLEVHQGKVGFCGGKEAFVVSDQSKLRFADVDFGWGRALYGGPGRANTGNEPGMVAAVVSHHLENGEEGLLLIFTMANEALIAFRNEVWKTVLAATNDKNTIEVTGISSSNFAKSAL
jgi:benzyl alcohol O-benzoyltransferase